ncbi:calcineurin-like phosphoesterase [Ferrovum sp. JA12]|nr:calcineurin-like phosphoesterase [Ferrovum sp. JA12]
MLYFNYRRMTRCFLLVILTTTCSHVLARNLYSYVLVGPNNQEIVRTIVDNNTCPVLNSGVTSYPMTLRVGKENNSQYSENQSFFPVAVCELNWPTNTPRLMLDGRLLPHLPSAVKKVAIIGDTGCRIKAPFAYQACNDVAKWPLKQVSLAIVKDKPDVLIHVGDYLYRESRCITLGCQGSVHGYGWDSWQADVFQPMQAMMASVPMVLVRGNHESCQRAGKGWYRFFDPYPYHPGQACINKRETVIDNPYSVVINQHTQWLIFDSAEIKEAHPDLNLSQFIQKMAALQRLLKPHYQHWLLLHHPSLGYAYSRLLAWNGGTYEVYQAIQKTAIQPPLMGQFDLFLQGHIHTFEISNYQEPDLPINVVSGMGGTQLEDRFPENNLIGYAVETGVHIKKQVNDQQFGYLIYTEESNAPQFIVKDAQGIVQQICHVSFENKEFSCLKQ